MNAYEAIEQFDTSVLESEHNPLFGEDNEVIGCEAGCEDCFEDGYEDPYEDPYERDESWFDEDALNSIGWGVDEAYF
jgi:hypothetical protein